MRSTFREPTDPRNLVLATVHENAPALLALARRHSLCADDAHDAYQRGVEIFLRRAETVEPETALAWLRTVVKHEALAVRRSRLQLVGGEEVDLDAHEASTVPSPEEQVATFDRVTASAEALQRLKPQEVRALWLKAQGLSYQEIGELTGWSYTKVNRCITEGRRAFIDRFRRIESGEECERWAPLLSAIADGEATSDQVVEARPHLRNCPACRATIRAFHATTDDLQAVLPVPAATAAAGAVASGAGPAASTVNDRLDEISSALRAALTSARETLAGLIARNPAGGEAAGAALVGGGGTIAAGGAKAAALCVSVTLAAGGSYCLDTVVLRDADADRAITAGRDRRIAAPAALRAERTADRRQRQANTQQIVQEAFDAEARRREAARQRRERRERERRASKADRSAPRYVPPPQPATPAATQQAPPPTGGGTSTNTTTVSTPRPQAAPQPQPIQPQPVQPQSQPAQSRPPAESPGGEFDGGGFEK